MQGGGLTGLVRTIVVDSALLSSDDAEALRVKVEASGLLHSSSNTEGGNQPDRPSYEITVENDRRSDRVAFSDAAVSDAVRALIEFVESVPTREDRLGPPG